MQLIFVTGKGGVGKSTITAALATLFSSLKLKVGVVELGESRMSDFFNLPPMDHEGLSFNPHLSLFNIDALSCFKEYASRHLPKHLQTLLQNKWVHSFIDATPGLNEILLLGKIHFFATETDWDFLLVDAPATGHAISLCDAPRIAYTVLKHGPLKSTVGKIWELLHDSAKTHFLLVTQPESCVVQETKELHQHLVQVLQLSVKGLVVNGTLPENPLFTDIIPKETAREAKTLVPLLNALQLKFRRQRDLVKILKKDLALPQAESHWDGTTTEEFHLRQTVAVQLKIWVLKNYLTKKS